MYCIAQNAGLWPTWHRLANALYMHLKSFYHCIWHRCVCATAFSLRWKGRYQCLCLVTYWSILTQTGGGGEAGGANPTLHCSERQQNHERETQGFLFKGYIEMNPWHSIDTSVTQSSPKSSSLLGSLVWKWERFFHNGSTSRWRGTSWITA